MATRDWLGGWLGRAGGWLGEWLKGRGGEGSPGTDDQPDVIDLPELRDTPPHDDTSHTPNDDDIYGPGERATLQGDWVKMASTNVDEIRYLVADKILEVVFLNGYAYQYYQVEAQVFLDFVRTSSPGRFVWNVLRADGYDYARVGTGSFKERKRQSGSPGNVVRRLLPEEREQGRGQLATLDPGQTVKKPRMRLKQADWRKLREETKSRWERTGGRK